MCLSSLSIKLLYWFTLCGYIVAASSHLFFPEYAKVQAIYSKNPIIIFFSNFSSYKQYAFKTIYVEIYGTGENVAAGGDRKFESRESTHFGRRLSAAVFDAKSTGLRVFMLLVFDANFEDNVKLSATVLYTDASSEIKSITSITELEVLGGPVECGLRLPTMTNVNTTGIQRIEKILCGKPAPNVSWHIGGNMATGSSQEIGKAKYRFILLLSNVTLSMCGIKVSFHATGYSNTDINGETILNVIYKPSVALKLNYRLNTYCLKMEWSKVDVGTCSGFIYQVQYLNQTGTLLATTNHLHPASEYTYCKGNINDIKDVRVRSIFNGQIGEWDTKNVSLVKPKITRKGQISKSGGVDNDDEDKWKNWVIIGSVLGGLLLIVFVILLIYYCCCNSCLICCGCKKKKGQPTESFGYNDKRKIKNDTNQVVFVATPTDPAIVYSNTRAKMPEQTTAKEEYFDPSEFGLCSSSITSQTENTTGGEDKSRFFNNPSMLI